MSDNSKELTTFIRTKSGEWLMEELEKLRRAEHEKGEKTPSKAVEHAAKASGINECINWIKSAVASPKGK